MASGFFDDEVDLNGASSAFLTGPLHQEHPFDGIIGTLPGHHPSIAYRMNVSNVGGYNKHNPFYIYNQKGEKVQLYYEGGKKKLKRVPLPIHEEKVIKKEEALEDPKLLFKYLKQQNYYYDEEYKEKNRAFLNFEEKKPPASHQ